MIKIASICLSMALLAGCSGIASISQPPSSEEIQAAKSIDSPIAVSAIFGHRNSANGIDIHITYQNLDTNKVIKYATFEVGLVNSVGDFVTTTIRKNKITKLKDTGPVQKDSTSWAKWKTAAYHPNATRLAIKSVQIEYMNGSKVSKDGLLKMPSSIGVIENKL